MMKKGALVTLFLCSLTMLAYAQNATQSISENKKEDVAISQDGNVSLDFRDADIHNVLKILSFKSGINIVAGSEVTGIVTIQLKDVPWKQALDAILSTYGYAYEQKGNILLVTTVASLKQRREDASSLADQIPLETKTFALNFSKASDVVVSMEKMKSTRGSVNFDVRTNALIVTDIPQQLELMAQVVKKLDTTTPQVMIESKIIETTFSDAENLGIDWITKVTVTSGQRPISWPFANHSVNKYEAGTFPSPAGFSYGTLNFLQVQAVFELLRNKSDTNILSNPRITTLDNKTAKITVGTQYPIPQYTYNEQQARLQVSGWEYKDIGIIFEVTPHVNNANFVTMDIQPKITSILGFVTVESTSLPQLSTEETTTSVIVKDAETLVIAGLVKSESSNKKKKTPFVGDVPILGLAFQKKERSVTKSDLLIFITPHIITPEMPSS